MYSAVLRATCAGCVLVPCGLGPGCEATGTLERDHQLTPCSLSVCAGNTRVSVSSVAGCGQRLRATPLLGPPLDGAHHSPAPLLALAVFLLDDMSRLATRCGLSNVSTVARVK